MADQSSCFKYNFALVSRVANSFAESSSYDLLRGERVDIDRARQEHETLVDALRRIGLDVVELPCDEKHPDGLFVDDVAVVINGTALICNPPSIEGRPSRQGEVCPLPSLYSLTHFRFSCIRRVFKVLQLDYKKLTRHITHTVIFNVFSCSTDAFF